MIKLFRHPLPKAEELTLRIHTTGRAIVYTTHKELAELKRDQVIAYGPDPRMKISKGPLRCYVEPAHGPSESMRAGRSWTCGGASGLVRISSDTCEPGRDIRIVQREVESRF